MKTKKGLVEERNVLKKQYEDIKAGIKDELTDEQASQLEEIRSKVTDINSEIADIETTRNDAKQVKTEERGVKLMDDKKFEQLENRASADLFRGELRGSKAAKEYIAEAQVRSQEAEKDGLEETRALQDNGLSWGKAVDGTAANGGVTIPTTVANTIIEKLQETSPVFALANKIGSITGNLRVAREDDNSDDGFVGELEEVKAQTPTLKYVDLTQKRVGASMQLSNMMINDGAPDIVSYSVGRLGRSLGKALERAILVGAKTGEDASKTFKPVVGDANVETVTLAGATPTLDDLIGLVTALNPAYLEGAVFVMSRDAFNAVAQLKDDDNEHLLFKPQMQTAIAGAVGVRPGYSFQGIPVFVSDQLNGNKNGQIVLGNFGAGYTVMTKSGLNLTHVTADTQQALAGGHLVVLDGYMDGAVTNPSAFVVAKGTASNA